MEKSVYFINCKNKKTLNNIKNDIFFSGGEVLHEQVYFNTGRLTLDIDFDLFFMDKFELTNSYRYSSMKPGLFIKEYE